MVDNQASCLSSTQPRRRVCLFGTSANPPTAAGGHLGIVQALVDLGQFGEIRVLPVYNHTFSSKRNQLVDFEHRLEMCRLTFAHVKAASPVKISVSSAEKDSFMHRAKHMDSSEWSSLRVGTADLLEFLMEEEPDADFTFCLGADTFLDFTSWKWKRSKEVLRLLQGRLIVLERPGLEGALGEASHAAIAERLSELRKLHIGNGFDPDMIQCLKVASLEPISSSMARAATERSALGKMVVPTVLDYIINNHLYSVQET